MLTIVAGGGWTDTSHLIDEFEALDSLSTSAYLLFMIQHESGWSYRLGSSYAMVKDPTTEQENYNEFYPNFGASKSFDLPFDLVGLLDISGGKHFSDTDALDSTDPDRKTQDNWDFSVSLGLRYQLLNVMLSPNYRYSKKVYTTDNSTVSGFATKDRIDHTNTLSIGADYPLFDNVNIGANYSFEQRDSNKATKYKAWNAGANFGLSLNF
jgi:predicted porin